jgi:dTDP-4-amino-4,6-dideoxygalactose transaminase
MGCFSFHPRKAITTGEGGVIVTDEIKIARRLRALRNHGQDPESPIPDFVLPGFNMRLTEFQAALGSVQLGKVERIIDRRRELAAEYDKLIRGSAIVAPSAITDSRHVYQSYVGLLPPGVCDRRDQIIRVLKENGIETTIGTYHIPMTTYYRKRGGFQRGHFPVTDDIAPRALSLPMFESLSLDEQQHVVKSLIALVELKSASAAD